LYLGSFPLRSTATFTGHVAHPFRSIRQGYSESVREQAAWLASDEFRL